MKILLGMSGGADSSAAALRLLRAGYDVTGATLLLTPTASAEDREVKDAAKVCRQLGIEHQIYDLRDKFARYVIDDFVSEYRSARTPNPCVRCNRTIKLGAMLDIALESGFDKIATGHYAKLERGDDGEMYVRKARSRKDQSYMLWQLDQRQLEHTVFPLGDAEKSNLREELRREGIEVFSKPDSQDICFVPDGDYSGFLERYAGVRHIPGDMEDENGSVVGRHSGLMRYTIGQRKGLGGGFPEPMFVIGFEPERNVLRLGREGAQYSSRMAVGDIVLKQSYINKKTFRAGTKIRYSAPEAGASVELAEDGRTARVTFDKPQRSITPGQSAVMYDGERVIGGGIILRSES